MLIDVMRWFTVTVVAEVVVSPPASRIVTRKLYAPALVNVATVFFAALVPLTEKVTGAGGESVRLHVYVRFDSPASSAPSTDSAVASLLTGFGVPVAAVATVGAEPTTLTLAVPFTVPLVAVTVSDP